MFLPPCYSDTLTERTERASETIAHAVQ
eukprot:COSAG04_NODE_32452_length_251_cov_0.657895_1_plen_27_part_10